MATQQQQQPTTFMLCMVTNGRAEASLSCAFSLLRHQTVLMTTPQPLKADMHFVSTVDEALNALRHHPSAVGAAILDTSLGFDPEFPLTAMQSGRPVVVASYPLPHVDWERVKAAAKDPGAEEPRFWGLQYSVEPSGAAPHDDGYVPVAKARLGVAWVTKAAVDDIVRRHPEVLSDDGTWANLASPGVYDGKRHTAEERFFKLYGAEVVADLQRPATSTGPMEFGGCVGLRTVLR